jgi:hypothetical protein
MQKHQPDILQQRELVAAAEGRAARSDAKASVPVGVSPDVADAFEAQRKKASVDRQRDLLKQTIHQTTHALARFFLEIDANHKQFQAARKLRERAQAKLDETRAAYEEGKTGFTIDRLLDAVVQYADAVVQEAQFKCSYNTALAALEEAKGTLLAERGVVVLDSKPRGAAAKGEGMALMPRIVEDPRTGVIGIDFDVKKAAFAPPAAGTPKHVAPDIDAQTSSPTTSGRAIRYDISLEGVPIPIQLKGIVSFGTPAGR